MRFITKVRAVFALIFGAIGWSVGGSVGIAALGTAVAGTWVVAIILGVLGWLLSSALMDQAARYVQARRREK